MLHKYSNLYSRDSKIYFIILYEKRFVHFLYLDCCNPGSLPQNKHKTIQNSELINASLPWCV